MINQLDVVISVDTAVAHLAGALGKSTWLLLPANADFRWLLDCSDSPWYPTMRIFRQSCRGDWQSVAKEVIEQLKIVFSLDLAFPEVNFKIVSLQVYKKRFYKWQ